MDCLFCKIIAGEIPSAKVYEDDKVYAFKDISPVAPVHVLVVPKKHYSSVMEVDDPIVFGQIFEVIQKLAKEFGVSEDGFRIVNNCGDNGCQSVKHIHFHLIGGKQLDVTMG